MRLNVKIFLKRATKIQRAISMELLLNRNDHGAIHTSSRLNECWWHMLWPMRLWTQRTSQFVPPFVLESCIVTAMSHSTSSGFKELPCLRHSRVPGLGTKLLWKLTRPKNTKYRVENQKILIHATWAWGGCKYSNPEHQVTVSYSV